MRTLPKLIYHNPVLDNVYHNPSLLPSPACKQEVSHRGGSIREPRTEWSVGDAVWVGYGLDGMRFCRPQLRIRAHPHSFSPLISLAWKHTACFESGLCPYIRTSYACVSSCLSKFCTSGLDLRRLLGEHTAVSYVYVRAYG